MATPKDFAVAMLNRLSLPVTTNNVISLVAFIGIEGTWPHGYNPFNSMLKMPGSTNMTSLGVQSYKDWADGVTANARTLSQSNMHLIIEALKRSAPPQEFLRALSDSPWCSAPETVQARSPHCNMQEGVLTHCYCDYAAFDAKTIANEWANKESAGAIDTSVGVVGWIKQHPILTAGGIVVLTGGVLYYLRPDLFCQVPVIGRLAAAEENPVKRTRHRRASRSPGAGGGKVQTLLFPRSSFTPSSAQAWAKSHGFKLGKVDVTDQYVRIRQLPPGGRMRTIQFQNTPVRAVVRFG